jgi:uncharacterized protein (DUF697 family)/tellurite resistance protein
MNIAQQNAILTIALFAAFADGKKGEDEREQIRQLADSLGAEANAPNISKLYQDVLLKRVDIASAAKLLTEPSLRQLAYEMSVCVCDADGVQNDAEKRFLTNLQNLLELNDEQAEALSHEANSIAAISEAAITEELPIEETAKSASTTAQPSTIEVDTKDASTGAVVAAVPNVPESELDKSILKYATLNGALELLPQSWASLAIIPMQIKLVYRIGKAYGVELDQGHIKEFLATLGFGLTSQYLEQFGRKLLGGLLGKAAGRMAGKIGGTATGMAFSFASTYALGQIAKRYYAGGRQMNTAVLRESFQNLLGPAKELQVKYLPEIQQTASGLDAAKVMTMIRGN